MSRRLLLGSLWGFVALAFVVGVAIGTSLPLFNYAALQADNRVLQKRLASQATTGATETSGTENTDRLEQQLASAESSIALLTVENEQLKADLAQAQSKPAQTTTKPSTTTTTTPKPTSSAGIVERSVAPSTIAPNGSFTYTAKTKGSVTKVSMRIAGTSGGVTYDYTYSLTKGATANGITTWVRTIKGPPKAGAYRLIGIAYTSAGRSNASAVTLTVQ